MGHHRHTLEPATAPLEGVEQATVVQAVARGRTDEERVADAVSRCEGPRGDCADPRRNPALARAALAARRTGAADADIVVVTSNSDLRGRRIYRYW